MCYKEEVMANTLDVRNMTRQKAPSFPFADALAASLPGWEISLAFVGETRARNLNQALRAKDYVPNVLSYETGEKSGEIVICLEEAKRQAPKYEMPYRDFVGFLFIHGCLHLKGMPHGTTMERKERAILARFSSLPSHGATHSNRH
jgi:probable rRNA maturation factor